MKVLVISSKYPPEYSGSGLRAHRTYLRLAEKFGYDVEVICSSAYFPRSWSYIENGVPVERIVSRTARNLYARTGRGPLRRLTNAGVFHAEARTVTKAIAAKSFDVLHVFGYSPATVAAILWSRKNRVPLILELVNPRSSPYQFLPGTRKFTRYSLSEQSVIVAIGAQLGDVCRQFGLTDNVWVRPNPVDTVLFRPADNAERLEARSNLTPFSPGDKVLLYVATFLARKKHGFLLEVLAALPDHYKLILAGPPRFDDEYSVGDGDHDPDRLKQRARDLGILDRVLFHTDFVDSAEYLKTADVFCFPAEDEAMGTVMVESLASGVPVVANSAESSFRQWITDGRNGYLRRLDAEAWARAIVLACEFDDSTRRAISSNINPWVDTEIIDEHYNSLLERLASSSHDETIKVESILAG